MITYHVEDWGDIVDEMRGLWKSHWAEVGTDRDTIHLAPDYGLYEHYAATGSLHIVTARHRGQIVGYHILIVRPHLHYKNDLHALTDVFYIRPEHRTGWAGVNLFRYSDKTLKQRGVKRVVSSTKTHLDFSSIFKRLRYRETEKVFTKVL